MSVFTTDATGIDDQSYALIIKPDGKITILTPNGEDGQVPINDISIALMGMIEILMDDTLREECIARGIKVFKESNSIREA